MTLYKIKNAVAFQTEKKFKMVLWKQLGLKWKLQSGIVVRIKNEAEWVIYNDIFVDGEYDLPIKQAISSAAANRPFNVIDIGANVGFFTLRLADLIWRSGISELDYQVTLVEGSPKVFEMLKTRLAEQRVLTDNLKLVHGLVGERQGSANISEGEFHVMNSITSNISQRGVRVPYVNLSSLCANDLEIDLLKCDIEGAEQSFLENYGDLLCKVKCAVFELHHNKCNTARCFDILKGLNFFNQLKLRAATDYSLFMFWK
jgi:FkbM family methyltransferase